jgi:hypothetical protein
MNPMSRIVLLVFILGVCMASGPSFAAELAPIGRQGMTNLETGAGPSRVRVRISTYEAGANEAAARRLRNATGIKRVSLVQELEIRVGARAVFVPVSVFSDLTELREGALRADDKAWVLTLAGGDASESYTVTIEFDRKAVQRRVLTSALAPQEPTQDTRYRLVVPQWEESPPKP